ncbi:MAG: ABC transporter permease [Rhodospirillaceae bacterium]|jgi:putative spermidine/putrescine transport system permease protein|nr:ABC transporter permease [Rhodospirillaceae bacterium]MBT6510751.1 ABC transporter permease [Rhodospirillaceae bacterium]MBT7647421.1 ABC transporter permease [Rhodospirillaceae bacterium]
MASTAETDVMMAADGVPLKIKLRRAERMRKVWAFGLVAPLLIFIVGGFIIPIISLMSLSVEDPELNQALPRTADAFAQWDGVGLPSNEAMMIFAEELSTADRGEFGRVSKRLNYDISGFKSMLKKTARASGDLALLSEEDILAGFVDIDSDWNDPAYWRAIKGASSAYSDYYMLWAIDLKRDGQTGDIVDVDEGRAVYVEVLIRTIEISVSVTVLCFIMGLPVAYLLATLPTAKSNLLLILVLLPFWTSLLVRTTSWLVLLQNEGLVNDLGIWIGLWNEPLELVRNRLGVYIAMVHILLPFMVLPMFSVMKSINPWHMRAAASLGAPGWKAFLKVYMPQCMPGVGAGTLLVFILSLGYYITPALVGGPDDQMVSYWIVQNMGRNANWGLGAALSLILLGITMVMFFIYNRFVGIDNLKVN